MIKLFKVSYFFKQKKKIVKHFFTYCMLWKFQLFTKSYSANCTPLRQFIKYYEFLKYDQTGLWDFFSFRTIFFPFAMKNSVFRHVLCCKQQFNTAICSFFMNFWHILFILFYFFPLYFLFSFSLRNFSRILIYIVCILFKRKYFKCSRLSFINCKNSIILKSLITWAWICCLLIILW